MWLFVRVFLFGLTLYLGNMNFICLFFSFAQFFSFHQLYGVFKHLISSVFSFYRLDLGPNCWVPFFSSHQPLSQQQTAVCSNKALIKPPMKPLCTSFSAPAGRRTQLETNCKDRANRRVNTCILSMASIKLVCWICK